MEQTQEKYLQDIVCEFGIELSSFQKSKDTALSEVYVINDTYILRGRARSENDIAKLSRELSLIERVRPLLSLSLPELIPAKSGSMYFETEKFLFTLYSLIPGKILCSWFNLKLCSDEKLEVLMRLLKKIHKETFGHFKKEEMNDFIEKDLKHILKEVRHLLSPDSLKRIEKAFEHVLKWQENLRGETLCFIHDDFHPGNVIFENDVPRGIVDLDWIRIGDPLEDLSYSVMMLMRLYDQEKFVFDKERLNLLLTSYGLEEDRREIFWEYLILFATYEISVSMNFTFENKDFYTNYQLSMLDFLIENNPNASFQM